MKIILVQINFKQVVIIFSIVLIAACSQQGRWGVFVTSSMYYPEVESSEKNVHFGNEKIYLTDSGFFKQTAISTYEKLYDRYADKPYGKGVVAYWEVKTPTIEKYYYAQSLPYNGIEISHTAKSGEPYLTHSFMSFGPMAISAEALTKEQLKTAKYIDTWGGNNKIYQWGEPQNYYYRILRRGINVEKESIDWQVVKGIEISKQQFKQLTNLCLKRDLRYSEMEGSKAPFCFLDGKVIRLTKKQSIYMFEHPFYPENFSK